MLPHGRVNSGIINSGITLSFEWKKEPENFVGERLSQCRHGIKSQSEVKIYGWDDWGKKKIK